MMVLVNYNLFHIYSIEMIHDISFLVLAFNYKYLLNPKPSRENKYLRKFIIIVQLLQHYNTTFTLNNYILLDL